MKISEFQEKLKIIKDKGFIRSKRKGSTGAGYTLEAEWRVKNNNIAANNV